jgi:hypothetical protein
MAFPDGMDHGACPASHPHRLITIFYEIIWNTPDFADMWYGNEQPFVLAQGDPTGLGFHGDFLNGKRILHRRSIGRLLTIIL